MGEKFQELLLLLVLLLLLLLLKYPALICYFWFNFIVVSRINLQREQTKYDS